MISLYSSNGDCFSNYGIDHFIERFGIAVERNAPSQSGIVIEYGSEADGDFVITVKENEIQNSLCGSISWKTEKIPVCEIPHDQGSGCGDVLAYFDNGRTRHPCVTRTERGISIGADIFRETGYLLSGHLDTIWPTLGNQQKNDLAVKPIVDLLENILFDAVLTGCRNQSVPLVHKSFWPDGKPFAVCLTHDIDEIKKTYQWVSRPLRFLARGDFAGFKGQALSFIQKIKGHEPYYMYDDILTIEESLGVKSTYFILKETGTFNVRSKKTWYLYGRNRSLKGPEIQALIRRLIANGDEIGVHGSYFSYTNPALLNEEKRELEEVTGQRIAGNRQHNLNIDIPRTWEYHVKAGLIYDTSLGFKDRIGFRWGTSFPFSPNNGKETLPLLEIPLTIMDICLESCPDKERECLCLADIVEGCHGVLTLLWHPPIFNILEYPDARDLYIRIIRYCKEKNAWIARASDITEWIALRNRISFTYRHDGKTCVITPHSPESVLFFTIVHPPGAYITVISNNARIICREKNCVYITTYNLQGNCEIIVGIT